MAPIYIKKYGILVLFNVPRSVEFFCRYRCTSSTESQSLKALEALAPRRAGSHVRTEKLYVSWYIKAREIQVINHHHANNDNGKATYICLLAPTFSSQQIECMSTDSQRMFFQRIAGAVLNGLSTPRTKQLADFCEIHGTGSCFRDGSGLLKFGELRFQFSIVRTTKQQSSI
eukprot:scaffold1001_cov83-Cylindrotheca_fusiformis.AAC.1